MSNEDKDIQINSVEQTEETSKEESLNNTQSEVNNIEQQVYGKKSKSFTTSIAPVRTTLQMNLHRLGIITSNLSLVGVVLLAFSFAFTFFSSTLFPFALCLNGLIVVIIGIFTLFTIFLKYSFSDLMIVKSDDISKVISFVEKFSPILMACTGVLTIASLVLLVLDRKNLTLSRIFTSIILTIIFIICVIIYFVGGVA